MAEEFQPPETRPVGRRVAGSASPGAPYSSREGRPSQHASARARRSFDRTGHRTSCSVSAESKLVEHSFGAMLAARGLELDGHPCCGADEFRHAEIEVVPDVADAAQDDVSTAVVTERPYFDVPIIIATRKRQIPCEQVGLFPIEREIDAHLVGTRRRHPICRDRSHTAPRRRALVSCAAMTESQTLR